MRYHLAIDFGTTNSGVAYRSSGQPEVEFFASPGLSDPGADGRPPLIRSLLYVKNGQTGEYVLGQSVLAKAWHSPDKPVRQVAEYLVKTYSLKLGV